MDKSKSVDTCKYWPDQIKEFLGKRKKSPNPCLSRETRGSSSRGVTGVEII
jgi:hypothetical protein